MMGEDPDRVKTYDCKVCICCFSAEIVYHHYFNIFSQTSKNESKKNADIEYKNKNVDIKFSAHNTFME